MKKQLITFFGVTSLFFAAVTANAADGDTDLVSFEFGYTGQTVTDDGSSAGAIEIENNGHERIVHLVLSGFSNDPNNFGSFNWTGEAPQDAIKVKGVSSMSVEFDTCAYPGHGRGPCGYVNFTINTSKPASGSIVNGSTTKDFGLYYLRFAGSYQTRDATASGYIIGVPVNSSAAEIGIGQDVEIELVTHPQ